MHYSLSHLYHLECCVIHEVTYISSLKVSHLSEACGPQLLALSLPYISSTHPLPPNPLLGHPAQHQFENRHCIRHLLPTHQLGMSLLQPSTINPFWNSMHPRERRHSSIASHSVHLCFLPQWPLKHQAHPASPLPKLPYFL